MAGSSCAKGASLAGLCRNSTSNEEEDENEDEDEDEAIAAQLDSHHVERTTLRHDLCRLTSATLGDI